MGNLVEHLHRDGYVVFSTPFAHANTVLQPEWEHHKIEYSSASLYDFLKRYFHTLLIPDDGTLPHVAVFELVNKTGGPGYCLRLNPILCKDPIIIANPFKRF